VLLHNYPKGRASSFQQLAIENSGHDDISSKKKILSEIIDEVEQYNARDSPSYFQHKENLQRILSAFSSNDTKDIFERNLQDFFGLDEFKLYHFASSEDKNQAENKNVNDKFWKLGLRYGSVLKQPRPVRKRKSSIFQISVRVRKMGTLRYVFSDLNGSEGLDGTIQVRLAEFQWLLFNRIKVYWHVINRKENWKLLFEGGGFYMFDISSLNKRGEAYERTAIFIREPQPKKL